MSAKCKPGGTLIKKYIDVHGKERTIMFHSVVPYMVPFMGNDSTAKRWILEDGTIVVIPDDAWSLVKKIKENVISDDP